MAKFPRSGADREQATYIVSGDGCIARRTEDRGELRREQAADTNLFTLQLMINEADPGTWTTLDLVVVTEVQEVVTLNDGTLVRI